MAVISKANREIYDLGENDFLVEFDLVNPTNTDVTYDLFNTTTLSLVPTSPTSTVQLPPSFVSYETPNIGARDGIAYNPVSNTVYAILNNDTIQVLNEALTVGIATLTVGGADFRNLAYDSANNRMYVTDFIGNSVTVVDCNSNTIIANIPVGINPSGIAFIPTNNTVYVCNTTSNDVSVIDCSTNTVIATVAVGTFPFGVAYNSLNNTVYVTNNTSSDISVIDCNTNTVITTILVANPPREIAYNSVNNRMYVRVQVIDSVVVLNCFINLFIATIALPSTPRQILYIPSFNLVYVNTTSTGTRIIDGDTNVLSPFVIPVGDKPTGIAYNTNNSSLYIPRDDVVATITIVSSLSAPPNAYITGSFDYNQFIQDIINNPVCVERVVVVSQNTRNFNQVINVVSKDANGIECQFPFIPSLSVGMNQFQNGIGKVDFLDSCLVLGVNQYFSNFLNVANSIVKVLLIYKQLQKSKLLTDKKGIVGRLDFKPNPIKEYKPTKDAPAFDYFQKVDKPKIRPFSIKQLFK
jgi:YVTN family beta-propeller protein